jgi:regulator of protease activity HflC (stomatin/prohibitin superfamily)
MEKNLSNSGATNWVVLLVAGVTLVWLAVQARLVTAAVGSALVLVGFLVSLVSWFQMRLEARAEAERLEVEALGRSRNDSALFSESAAETFPARRAREQFERWLVPAFTFVLFVLQALGVWHFYEKLRGEDAAGSETFTPLALAVAAALGFALFLFGRYAARLAQLKASRLLRPSASAVMLGALLAGTAAVTAGLEWAGFAKWDVYLAWVLTALLALVAAETLCALVFEIYRPRTKGQAQRVLYESRILGLLGQSGGLFSTAAQALDYQFGFKVSDTWFYHYLEQTVSGLALFWLGILWLSSCLVIVEPQEQGLHERFGQPTANPVLEPGLHFKLPWPIDAAPTFKTRELQSFIVGVVADDKLDAERVLVWTRAHYREETPMLVASREQETGGAGGEQAVPVNFITASIPVQFVVRDVKAWAYNQTEPAKLLERIATREVVRHFASVDMDKVMSYGRLEAATELQSAIQKQSDALKLGAEIVFVGLQDIHPPMGTKENPVASAYEQVIGAIAQKEAKILEAEGYWAETLPTAGANATRKLNNARARAAKLTGEAAGRSAQFANQLAAYQAAPKVFLQRTYLDTLTKSLAPTRKLVLGPTNTTDVIQFNLEDKLRQDMTDLYLEDPAKKN